MPLDNVLPLSFLVVVTPQYLALSASCCLDNKHAYQPLYDRVGFNEGGYACMHTTYKA